MKKLNLTKIIFINLNIIFIIISCSPGENQIISPTTYYISKGGNDSRSGTSPEKAWNSISKINSHRFKPGDSILFKRGETWREDLKIKDSGEKELNIVISAYGEGQNPRILGSEKCDKLSRTAKVNIWKSEALFENPDTWYDGNIFFELNDTVIWGNAQKEYEPEFANLQENYDWCWNNKNIYIYCEDDPNRIYNSIEVAQRKGVIILEDTEYLTIEHLEIAYAQRWGICLNREGGFKKLHGLTVKNCEISHIGIKNGMSAYGIFTFHSDLIIENNIFHDCGRRAISYTIYNSVGGMIMDSVIVQNNVFYNGYHTTAIDCQILNLRNANKRPDTLRNFHFRNNLIYNSAADRLDLPNGNTSNDIFFKVEDTVGSKSAYMSDVYIYNNIILNSKSRAILIDFGDKIHVWNNTIIGSNKNKRPKGSEIWALVVFNATNQIDFRNNIIYGNATYDLQGPAACIYIIKRGDFKPNLLHFDYNLFYQMDKEQRIIYSEDGPTPEAVTYISSPKGIGWSEYLQNNRNENQNSLIHIPDMIYLEQIPLDSFYTLHEGFPIRNAGVNIPNITRDYFGNPMNVPPDIGAIQHYLSN